MIPNQVRNCNLAHAFIYEHFLIKRAKELGVALKNPTDILQFKTPIDSSKWDNNVFLYLLLQMCADYGVTQFANTDLDLIEIE